MTKIYIKLIAMSLALILSVSVVIMSSYAWLVLSGNPAVTGIQVAIGGGNTILTAPNVKEVGADGQVYNYPGYFSDKMNFGQQEHYAYLKDLGNLTPVSTSNGVEWFLPTYYSVNDELVQQGKVLNGALKDITEFEVDDSLDHANLPMTNQQEVNEGNYIYLDFWVVSPGGDYTLRVSTGDGAEDSGSFVIDLMEPASSQDTLEKAKGSAAAAVRVGFLANDVMLIDDTMLKYQASRYSDKRFTALRGMYKEPDRGVDLDMDKFTIYEPNADYHPEHEGLEGQYVQTKSLEMVDDIIQEQEKNSNLTVQKKSTWVAADNGIQKKIEQYYHTAMVSRLGMRMSKEDNFNYFYGTYLQGQLSPYVEKGAFVGRTNNLYANMQNGIVSAEFLQQENNGATTDVEIIKLERNVPQRIRMFIWLEGQDIDCVDKISSARFAVNIELAGGDQ